MERTEPLVALPGQLQRRDLADEVDDVGRGADLRDDAVVEVEEAHGHSLVMLRRNDAEASRKHSDRCTVASFVLGPRPPRGDGDGGANVRAAPFATRRYRSRG